MPKLLSLDEILNANYQEALEGQLNMIRPRLMSKSLSNYKAHLKAMKGLGTLADILGTGGTSQVVTDPDTDPEPTPTDPVLPSTISVVVVPDELTTSELKALHDIMAVEAFISASAASHTRDKMLEDGGWNIPVDPKDNAKFVQTFAQGKYKALIEDNLLGSKLSISSLLAHNYEKVIVSGNIHLEFLGEIFGGFNFSEAVSGQLDSIMTSIVKSLGNVEFSYESDLTNINYVVSVYHFEKVVGLNIKIPKLRIFYLNIDQSSWSLSVGKSNVSSIKFKMHYFDVQATLNFLEFTIEDRERLNAYVSTITELSPAELATLTAPVALTSNPA